VVSRSRNFVFYPALVRLAFGKCAREDVSFDLRHAVAAANLIAEIEGHEPVAHYSFIV